MKKKKADFGNFSPPTICINCKARGEVKDEYITRAFGSSNWTYKKCLHCNGTGKNIWTCLTCEELLQSENGWWCSNQNCKMYNIKIVLANKKN